MPNIGHSVFKEYDFFKRNRYSEKRGKRLSQLISPFPALLFWVLRSSLIAFLGCDDCFFKHFVEDIVFSDTNGGCAFDEGESDLKRSDFVSIHEIN